MKNTSALFAVILIIVVGCEKASPTISPRFAQKPGGAVGWSQPHEGEVVKPGIDEAQVLYFADHIVVWSDLPRPTATSIAYSIGEDRLTCGGQLINQGPGLIEFTCQINDRESGTVDIADQTYSLSDGGLFLVSTRSGEVKVRQLDIDLTNIEMTEAGLRAVANSTPAISNFFGDHSEIP